MGGRGRPDPPREGALTSRRRTAPKSKHRMTLTRSASPGAIGDLGSGKRDLQAAPNRTIGAATWSASARGPASRKGGRKRALWDQTAERAYPPLKRGRVRDCQIASQHARGRSTQNSRRNNPAAVAAKESWKPRRSRAAPQASWPATAPRIRFRGAPHQLIRSPPPQGPGARDRNECAVSCDRESGHQEGAASGWNIPVKKPNPTETISRSAGRSAPRHDASPGAPAPGAGRIAEPSLRKRAAAARGARSGLRAGWCRH